MKVDARLRPSLRLRAKRVVGILFAITAVAGAWAQPVVSVTDTTGWTGWTKPDNTIMTDAAADQQTGQGSDDFVGDTTFAAFAQKAGTIGGVDHILFQARMNVYRAQGFASYITLGMDLDGNGSIDLMLGMDAKSSQFNLKFATPGTGANTSPSTTTWGSFQGGVNLDASTYNYAETTTSTFGGNNDALVNFGISFANLQAGIRAYAPAAFANFTMTYNTTIAFVAWTTTQQNAVNQDMMGYTGKNYTKDTTTYADLGAITPPISPYGGVPEPATYAQLGLLLLAGAGITLWRRRRARPLAPATAQPIPPAALPTAAQQPPVR